MIALTLVTLAVLYLGLFLWVGFKAQDWSARLLIWLSLLSPVAYVVWSYKAMHERHQEDCSSEGGLKVFIQPEKTDRIRLDMDSFSRDRYAYGYLNEYFPQLAVVEAWDGGYTGNAQKTGYFAYSPDPATTASPKKDWKFNKVPLTQPTVGLYELSKSSQLESEVTKTTWKLLRNGQVYATWTMFDHYWSRNGAMNIGWQCFGPSSIEWAKRGPAETLIALILK